MDWLGDSVDLEELNDVDPIDPSEWASLTTLEDGIHSESPMDHSLPAQLVPEANPKRVSPRPPAKIGTRFSQDAVRILRAWFSSHEGNPYPNEKERLTLELQTGLNSTQVYNWLANARRRRPRSMFHEPATPSRQQSPAPINIPQRPGTPMIPLQRWMDSPPEDEPVEVASIVRAMEDNSCRLNQAENLVRGWSGGSSRCSSASSVDSSHSRSSSLRSAASWTSSNSIGTRRRSRRQGSRRGLPRNLELAKRPLVSPTKPYQCTFCTDSFGKKYEWQRHEKSLHLPVDRWKCCPDQPRLVNGPENQPCCVFCGETNPSTTHMESHSPTSCQEREFARKDHLKQHLRLVHNGTLLDSFQAYWKADAPDIRSRCGFCGESLASWMSRTDHLADHFRAGQDMADWKGDWGFDEFILARVENAIPPYLVVNERDTPFPYAASTPPVEAPRCAYERIKIDLLWFLQSFQDQYGVIPSDDQFQLETCRIIFSLDSLTSEEALERDSAASWLRDLVTSNPEISQRAKLAPVRRENESAFSSRSMLPRATSYFEGCPLEYELRRFVRQAWASGRMDLTDSELQDAACTAILEVDARFAMPLSTFVAKWLVKASMSSTTWLQKFKERMGALKLRVFGAMGSSSSESRTKNDRAVTETEFPPFYVNGEIASTQSTAPNLSLDAGFGVWDVGIDYNQPQTRDLTNPAIGNELNTEKEVPFDVSTRLFFPVGDRFGGVTDKTHHGPEYHPGSWITKKFYFLNDPKYQQLLSRELKRWVKATISPNNPTMHIPSDEELRHQARCMMYDDDASWDRTPADSPEWLRRFREEAGI
ncbi:unnamed protein product [Clonostachys chloroleuca]|uniref:Homeobox protein 4 n=1 Tax=Clonostachys chloroleuca TaxID=1926264 RepID=A0AA35MI38_9HYPO|nr:unnamed protein product [Clonostachys chloroleuca]